MAPLAAVLDPSVLSPIAQGIWLRFRYVWPSEAETLHSVEAVDYFRLLNGKSKQLIIFGIDLTVLMLVGGRILATLRRPRHLMFLQRSEDLAGFLTRKAVMKEEKKRLAHTRAAELIPRLAAMARRSSLGEDSKMGRSPAASECSHESTVEKV